MGEGNHVNRVSCAGPAWWGRREVEVAAAAGNHVTPGNDLLIMRGQPGRHVLPGPALTCGGPQLPLLTGRTRAGTRDDIDHPTTNIRPAINYQPAGHKYHYLWYTLF